jgi:hypothetical protein
MFDLFKKDKDGGPMDVKEVRNRILQFIREQLSKAEGGEGHNIRGLHLFLNPREDERHVYESAVYSAQENRFRNEEVQRIADDFAIDLPEDWTLEVLWDASIPSEAMRIPGLSGALFIRTRKRSLAQSSTAYLRVLGGEAEQEVYTIQSNAGKITIGREKKVQVEEGFFRINQIAFPGNSKNDSNKFISRQHAHIQFDSESGVFFLFADEGGVPPGNKVKVKSSDNPEAVKLFSTDIGHALQEGDQIVLGESAVLEFSYSKGGQ